MALRSDSEVGNQRSELARRSLPVSVDIEDLSVNDAEYTTQRNFHVYYPRKQPPRILIQIESIVAHCLNESFITVSFLSVHILAAQSVGRASMTENPTRR